MAINYPNDPATDPGDGGQWTDPDGNLWQVEIVSGEAIWTMTEAADTGGGGGGGAVDSVNSQTGVVSLGIQDMNDYGLNNDLSGVVVYQHILGSHQNDGEYQVNGDGLLIKEYDANGVQSVKPTTNGTIYLSTDGASFVAAATGTVGTAGTGGGGQSNRAWSISFEDATVYSNLGITSGQPLYWSNTPATGTPIALSEGDILQWNNANQKFKPAQLAAGTPLDGLLSVDGDAVKYGTAPTLGVDGTDLVIPTMGQVRGAIASNGGTSVSLNDLSDVSYSSGDLTVTGLTDITFEGDGKISDGNTNELSFTSTGLSSNANFDAPLVSTTEVQIKDSLNYISLTAPTLAGNLSLTLPATDGQNGYVLSTDGAGNLTFAAPPNPAEAIRQYDIDYVGTTAYKFTGPGLDGTEENPAIYVSRGDGIVFSNLLGAHPFQLQTVAGTGEAPYTDGVTGAQPISVGSFAWVVPMDAPSTLYYQCTAHTAMSGVIYVLDNSGGGGAGAVESVNSQTGVVSLGIQDMDDYGLYPKANQSAYHDRKELYWNTVDDFAGGFGVPADDEVLINDDLPASGVSLKDQGWNAGDSTIWISKDGLTWTSHTGTSKSTGGTAVFEGLAPDVSAYTSDVALYFSVIGPDAGEPLAEGDILQWVDADQKFKPAQVAQRIQDMDDYHKPSEYVFDTFITPQNPNEAGEWHVQQPGLANNLAFAKEDANGVATSVIKDLPIGSSIWLNGVEFTTDANGGNYSSSGTVGSWYVGIAEDLSAVDTSGGLTITLEAPVADGDILQWNDADQAFKPTALVNNDTKRIQDMDDYQANQSSTQIAAQWSVVDGNQNFNVNGAWLATSTTRLVVSDSDDDGVDQSNFLSGLSTIWVSQDGVTFTELTVSSFSDYNTTGTLIDFPTPHGITNAGYVILANQDLGFVDVPLAEGDILQWNNANQKFQPAQLDYSQINNTPVAPSRKSVVITTAALAIDATETGEITGTGATGFLISCQTTVAAWVRLYCTSDAMTADASRDVDTDPVPGSGVLFEALYSTNTEKPITPGTTYFNLSGEDKLYYRITNKSAIADTPITGTFKLLPME